MKSIKNPQEILLIEQACKLGDKTFDYILGKIKPGVTEKQIALGIMRFIRKNKAKLSFKPIVAFGKNSVAPHHRANDTKLKKGDIVLLDLGAKLNDYCSDMTRTVFMGKATSKQKKIYHTVLEAQQKAIEQLNNETMKQSLKGIRASKIDSIARSYIISKGYPPMPHSLGHGVGKKVHEAPKLSPKSKKYLRENMVFSVEPGIYIAELGGIRIEDLVVLEKTGPRLLTNSPKHLIEL